MSQDKINKLTYFGIALLGMLLESNALLAYVAVYLIFVGALAILVEVAA